MTNDLEQRLRSSLQDRAQDVEPTPELWRQVERRLQRRRALPLLVWTAAGVAAAVTAVAVVPGLVDGTRDGLDIQPVGSPTTVDGTPSDPTPGPAASVPLTHYVAVMDGRLVLRGIDGSEEVLWEGESAVRTLAVRPGSTPEDPVVAFVTSAEGMLDLRVVGGPEGDWVVSLGRDAGDAAVDPTPTWSPEGDTVGIAVPGDDGGAELVLADLAAIQGDGDGISQRSSLLLGDLADPTQLRLQDWTADLGGHRLLLTAGGRLLQLDLARTETGWQRGALTDTGSDAYVVDVATGEAGAQYRLLAGGSSTGDAEEAGLRLEVGNEVVPLSGLATADPSGAWMTAVEGGAFVGLGDEGYVVHRAREGSSPSAPFDGMSYAAWVPVPSSDAGDPPKGPPPAEPTPSTDGPRADGPLSASGVTPYAVVDERGRVAVVTGDGGEREVIVHQELWSHEAAVSVQDVAVRPGSSAGEVSGVVLLATEGGPELAWFRAAAGATATARMEGATGLGAGDTGQRDAPTWSPDGRHLAWVEPADDGGWTLRTVGVDDDGPTHADAGFGLDIDAERLRVARWTWLEETSLVARGELSLVGPAGEYVVPVERQGDGALAVGRASRMSMEGVPGDEFLDLGARGDVGILLVREGDRIVLWQEGPTELPFTDLSDLDLDLDVLDGGAVVTDRATGEAYVIDRAGGVAPLGADAATTFGFDPVR